MRIKTIHLVVATSIVAVGVGSVERGAGASADRAASARAADARAPSGAYESRLPDGTTIRLTFRDGGAVRIAMTEDGKTDAHEGKWIVNGEVILVQGGEEHDDAIELAR